MKFWTEYGNQFPLDAPSLQTGKVKAVVVPFLTEHHTVRAYWGSGGIAPHILDLDTRWK
jgi:hypothetical protein